MEIKWKLLFRVWGVMFEGRVSRFRVLEFGVFGAFEREGWVKRV